MAKRYYDSMYASDAGMIKEDRSKTANLPQEVIMKTYAEIPYHNESSLNDTISGIDKQMRDDVKAGDIKTGSMPEKY